MCGVAYMFCCVCQQSQASHGCAGMRAQLLCGSVNKGVLCFHIRHVQNRKCVIEEVTFLIIICLQNLFT